MKIIGLTGGIGSGKSTVADLWAEWGNPVVDTDVIAHELTGPGGAALESLRTTFGTAVIAENGRLNRVALRRLVFADASARLKLEEILHPMIQRIALQQATQNPEAPFVVIVIPLLTTSTIQPYHLQRVVVVDCPDEVRIERVMQRSPLSREEVLSIMAAQLSRHERLSMADDVIHNEGDLSSLRAQVETLTRQYRHDI